MIILFLFFCFNICSEIVQTSSAMPVLHELNKANSVTLIIIDLFDVVICFEEEVLNNNNKKSFQKYLKQFKEEKTLKEEQIKKYCRHLQMQKPNYFQPSIQRLAPLF